MKTDVSSLFANIIDIPPDCIEDLIISLISHVTKTTIKLNMMSFPTSESKLHMFFALIYNVFLLWAIQITFDTL